MGTVADNKAAEQTIAPNKAALIAQLEHNSDRLATSMKMPAASDWPDIELTMPQLRTIGLLRQGPRRMGDLAGHLRSSLSAITVMVERLEGKGLVERSHDPHDRRVVYCRLTAAGQADFERFWRLQRLRLSELADLLTVPELERLVEATQIIVEALERQKGCATPPTLLATGDA